MDPIQTQLTDHMVQVNSTVETQLTDDMEQVNSDKGPNLKHHILTLMDQTVSVINITSNSCDKGGTLPTFW